MVYGLNTRKYKSTDGGVTFDVTIRTPHGDQHDLWIDPSGRWVVATFLDASVHYLPLPRGRPLHRSEVDEFLDILRAQTNIRIAIDYESDQIFRKITSEFPGFDTVPTWQEWASDEYYENRPWRSIQDAIEEAALEVQ